MSSTMEPSVWLWKLLKATFYEPCEIHKTDQPRKKQNPTDTSFFCIHCLVSACELCVKNGGSHGNHPILRVYKASRNVSVRKTELAALIDVSKIQVFSVNGTFIYFLNPRGEDNNNNGGRNKGNACVSCGWELKSDNFCSIYCKMRSSESLRLEAIGEEGESSSGRSSVTETQKALKPQQSQSFRKRSRKGVPCRAPFF